MKTSFACALALGLASTSLMPTIAASQEVSKTRAEVRAELAEAVRTGEMVADPETGQKWNELNPGMYPAKPVSAGKTRAQVMTELAEAVRTGDLIGNYETGQKLNEMFPGSYPRSR